MLPQAVLIDHLRDQRGRPAPIHTTHSTLSPPATCRKLLQREGLRRKIAPRSTLRTEPTPPRRHAGAALPQYPPTRMLAQRQQRERADVLSSSTLDPRREDCYRSALHVTTPRQPARRMRIRIPGYETEQATEEHPRRAGERKLGELETWTYWNNQGYYCTGAGQTGRESIIGTYGGFPKDHVPRGEQGCQSREETHGQHKGKTHFVCP
jgi:hypothetical protein